jgi:sugar diacid utilization regulator
MSQFGEDSEDYARLQGVLVLGSAMFESFRIDDVMRITASGVTSVSSCVLLAGYTADTSGFRRVYGESDRTLDLLVNTSSPQDGALDSALAGWVCAIFLRRGSEMVGCLVLAADSAPDDEDLTLLNALAHPAAAAIAATMLIEQQRELAAQLRRVTEIQSETNDAMAATIRHLNAHQRVRDTLTRAATSGAGTRGLARALNSLIRLPVVVQDVFGSVRAYVGPSGSPAVATPHLAEFSGSSDSDRFEGWRVSPVGFRTDRLGFVGVLDPELIIHDADLFAIEYASALLAVDLSNARSMAEVELRLGRDLVADLLSGQDADGSATRADALHYDVNMPQRVVLARWEPIAPAATGSFEVILRKVLSHMRLPALVSHWSDATVAIVSGTMDGDRLYRELVKISGGGRGSIGVGGPGEAAQLPSFFAEAKRALQVRARMHEPYGITTHAELGLDRILDPSNDGIEVEGFIRQWLGPLLDYDQEKQSELVPTLSAYLDAGGKYDATATALIIHRSTLRYRLAHIRELCGRDFSDPDVRLNLHVAVRAWSVMQGSLLRKGGRDARPLGPSRRPD